MFGCSVQRAGRPAPSCLINQATEVVTDLRNLALCTPLTPLCSLYPAFTGGGAENPWHQDTSEHALHSFRVAANLHYNSPPGLQLQMCVADGNCMFTAVLTACNQGAAVSAEEVQNFRTACVGHLRLHTDQDETYLTEISAPASSALPAPSAKHVGTSSANFPPEGESFTTEGPRCRSHDMGPAPSSHPAGAHPHFSEAHPQADCPGAAFSVEDSSSPPSGHDGLMLNPPSS